MNSSSPNIAFRVVSRVHEVNPKDGWLSTGSFCFLAEGLAWPNANYEDCPWIIAEMWLDDLLACLEGGQKKFELRVYDNPDRLRVARVGSALSMRVVGGALNGRSFEVAVSEFNRAVIEWIDAILVELRSLPDQQHIALQLRTKRDRLLRASASH